jgi:hypothetical protein
MQEVIGQVVLFQGTNMETQFPMLTRRTRNSVRRVVVMATTLKGENGVTIQTENSYRSGILTSQITVGRKIIRIHISTIGCQIRQVVHLSMAPPNLWSIYDESFEVSCISK